MKKHLMLLFFAVFVFACFGTAIDTRGSVKKYEGKGLIKTIGGAFQVGELPASWKEHRIEKRAILFRNDADSATITVSSWCKGAFDDGSTKDLAQQLISALESPKILSENHVDVDGRKARVTVAQGIVDGAGVYLKTAVIKRDGCVFDFYYVSQPEKIGSVSDFDALLQGFRFLKGPSVL